MPKVFINTNRVEILFLRETAEWISTASLNANQEQHDHPGWLSLVRNSDLIQQQIYSPELTPAKYQHGTKQENNISIIITPDWYMSTEQNRLNNLPARGQILLVAPNYLCYCFVDLGKLLYVKRREWGQIPVEKRKSIWDRRTSIYR